MQVALNSQSVLKSYLVKTTCTKSTWAVVLTISPEHSFILILPFQATVTNHGRSRPLSPLLLLKEVATTHFPEQRVSNLFKLSNYYFSSSVYYKIYAIQLLEFHWMHTYQIPWENNNKDMNNVFYNIKSANLSWNPFIHFFFTNNSHYYSPRNHNRITYSKFHILFIYKNRDLHIPEVITPTFQKVQLHSLHSCRVTTWLYHWPEGRAPPHHSGHSSWTISTPGLCFRDSSCL